MKMKISNYIAGKLVEEGISQAFMVTGGGAMHLDDGLGHQEGLHCIYNHHEQACAMLLSLRQDSQPHRGAVRHHRSGRNQCNYRCGGGMAGFHSHAGTGRASAL